MLSSFPGVAQWQPDAYLNPGLSLFNLSQEFLLDPFVLESLSPSLSMPLHYCGILGAPESLSVLRPLGAICKTHTALNQALPGHSGSFLWVCLIFQSFEFSVKTHFAGQTFVIGELCWGREREQRFQEAMATHLACFEFYWGHAVWAKATEKIHTWPLILTVEKLTATQHLIFKTLGCCLVKSEARSPVLFP